MLNRIVLFFIFLGIFSAAFAIGAEVQVSEEESAIIQIGRASGRERV